MAKHKSILDKFTETMRGLADSASQALKSEEPAGVDEATAAHMPFAAEGFVSDPLIVPPVATPVRTDFMTRNGRRALSKRQMLGTVAQQQRRHLQSRAASVGAP